MDSTFEPINLYELNESVFRLLDKDWMLVTAGIQGNYNMMTASWGGMGVLWNKQVAFIFIRPQRHTYSFAEKYPCLTLTFFSENHRHLLQTCGSRSGQDINKMKLEGLTPIVTDGEAVAFEEARLIFECRKLYFDDIKPAQFLKKEIDKNYPAKDYHRMYICEITKAYKKK
ncbi:MAG TPA: flavin reductase [Bacteroidales bacterium]|nr:flavin reductase [Bacteroidales bacterium]HPB25858.1 flavin reductase [Bacteroidales bacterium]HPI30385.1 flavin reductase [Bacteroidales bacterium]HQN16244.1 flavin reductase [Bacteroidales bacterium]HQP15908.1 flavin reductase [Bacteroidales bacterium]